MTTITDIFHAFAPESLARSPPRPTSHQKVISALRHCRRGPSGPRLSQCPHCGGQHRVPPACGHRPCPQCPQHTTQQWLHHQLAQQLPGPHCLLTCTVPETLRPFLRSPQRLAYHAMCKASSAARKRLAPEERFLGTHCPGCTGLLHPWGRQLQLPPPSHDSVPGGGLAQDGAQWLPSRANCFVPVQALAPISRAIFKDAMPHHTCLDHIAPHVWTLPWNGHSQATPNGQTACTYLAPSGCKVAIANSRIVCLKDRTGTCTSRKPGSARPRTLNLDAMEFLRRCLPHGLPEGFMQVRHCGCMHASCAIHTATLRLMVLELSPIGCKPTQSPHPTPFVALGPPCGGQMRVIMRQWSANRAFFDTG